MNRFQILKGIKPLEIKIKNPSSSPWVGKQIFFKFIDQPMIQGYIRDVIRFPDCMKILIQLRERLPGNRHIFTVEDCPRSSYMLEEIELFEGTELYRGKVTKTFN